MEIAVIFAYMNIAIAANLLLMFCGTLYLNKGKHLNLLAG